MLLLVASTWTACDVHELPNPPERVGLHLKLRYDTEMTEWNFRYEGNMVTEQVLGKTYDNRRNEGKMRYIIRAYPISEKSRIRQDYTQEFVFVKDLAEGYNHEVTLPLLPGHYNLMVWSDILKNGEHAPYYNAGNFAEIILSADHKANTDYRDAFRGASELSLISDIVERAPDTLEVMMQRPLAKFEFITNDVIEFVEKESTRLMTKSNLENSTQIEESLTRVNIEDYRVVFYYVGFMPNAYSMYTDKPVDSSTGVMFESTLKKLTEADASMGFDYVFVNGKESAITVQIGIYDNEDTQLSLTEPIEVPLKRSHHTILQGVFLMSKASGGVTINPSFEDDYNLIFP